MDANRTISFSVALNKAEHRLLVALASYEERKPSDALRVALREAARRRGLLDSTEERSAIAMSLAEPHVPAEKG